MSRKIICLPEDCTACKACLNVCKLNCIEMVKDKQDVSRYKISVDKCIDCGLCRKVCPVLHNSKNQPHKAYVAWSTNEERHAKSASGGIAAELYSFLLKKNFSLVGTHLGYHRALIYRDNCYHCKFTTHQRCGDLTLADYSGLGTGGEVDFKHGSQLSCILCNTSRGENLISEIIADGVIKAYERPLTEELGNERQLNAPSIPHVNRDVFLATYKKTKNFEIAAYKALRKDIYKNELMHYLLVDKIIGLPRKIAKIILPERMKKYIKRWLHKK